MDTDFPPIAADPEVVQLAVAVAAAPPAQAPLKDIALASFVPIEAHVTLLAQRFANVAFDLSTPKGLATAKAARHELREDGRYAIQRLQKRLRDEANDLKKVLDAEGDRIIAIIKPVEDAVNAQIEAEEARREAERAERARLEAERVARNQAFITVIRSYLTRCGKPGVTAARMRSGIAALGDMVIAVPSIDEDFVELADVARRETMVAMTALCDAAQAREDAAAQVEAQRIENARLAAELAEQQAKLHAENEAQRRRIEAEDEALRQRTAAFEAERNAAAIERGRLMTHAVEQRQLDAAIADAQIAIGAFVSARPAQPTSQDGLAPEASDHSTVDVEDDAPAAPVDAVLRRRRQREVDEELQVLIESGDLSAAATARRNELFALRAELKAAPAASDHCAGDAPTSDSAPLPAQDQAIDTQVTQISPPLIRLMDEEAKRCRCRNAYYTADLLNQAANELEAAAEMIMRLEAALVGSSSEALTEARKFLSA